MIKGKLHRIVVVFGLLISSNGAYADFNAEFNKMGESAMLARAICSSLGADFNKLATNPKELQQISKDLSVLPLNYSGCVLKAVSYFDKNDPHLSSKMKIVVQTVDHAILLNRASLGKN